LLKKSGNIEWSIPGNSGLILLRSVPIYVPFKKLPDMRLSGYLRKSRSRQGQWAERDDCSSDAGIADAKHVGAWLLVAFAKAPHLVLCKVASSIDPYGIVRLYDGKGSLSAPRKEACLIGL
jgi:hypothetical protein